MAYFCMFRSKCDFNKIILFITAWRLDVKFGQSYIQELEDEKMMQKVFLCEAPSAKSQ